MIRSMTAFARREVQDEGGALIWELRSVNHRFLDVTLRLPEEFRVQEGALREKAQKTLGRGKLDCTLSYHPAQKEGQGVVVNDALAASVIAACKRIASQMEGARATSAMDILQWPGVAQESKRDLHALMGLAGKLFGEALTELVETREREGARLEAAIDQRCEAIREVVASVRERRPQVLQGLREKLLARIADIDVAADNHRLEQELAIIAQRLDVDEELDRLDTHLDEIARVLKANEPVGRRLDFLMQELNREANTLASKANDAQTTKAAVDLKVLIEQMREQVQNVE